MRRYGVQDLNDLFYLARVVESGGFASAGRELGIPKSRLSRRILELEARLGVRLLQRSTRKVVLTDVGERFYRHCEAMLAAAEMAEETVAQWTSEARGRVRLSCPVLLSQTVVGPMIPEFLAAHPRVQLELVITNRRIELVEEGVDVAVRVRHRGDDDPSYIARRLCPMPSVLVGAPSLLNGRRLEGLDQLDELPVLGVASADRKVHFRLTRANGEMREVALEPRLATEDFSVRKRAALAGLGITLLPLVYCGEELSNGSLVQAMPEWRAAESDLVLVYPHRRGLVPAVRALVEHLSAGLGAPNGTAEDSAALQSSSA